MLTGWRWGCRIGSICREACEPAWWRRLGDRLAAPSAHCFVHYKKERKRERKGGSEGGREWAMKGGKTYLGMQDCRKRTNTMSRSSFTNPVDMERKMMVRQSAGHKQNRTRHTLAI